MIINNVTIVFDECGHDSMSYSRDGSEEIARILRELADRIEECGVVERDGCYLKDYNGNTVGSISVDWSHGDDE